MKATGMVRRIDDLGRIVLPKEIRKTHNINEGDPMEIYVDEDKVVLQKYNEPPRVDVCRKCGCDISNNRLVSLIDKNKEPLTLCSHCIAEFTDEI